MSIGPLEIAIIVVILLLLFGARKLPDLGKGLGSGMREFKDGILGDKDDEDEDEQETLPEPASSPEPDRSAENQRH